MRTLARWRTPPESPPERQTRWRAATMPPFAHCTAMPDFRSDTVTQPTPAMREAMFRAPLGDDVFADDPSANALQAHAAALLGFEAALFAPSGTQTNLIALWGHCQRGDEAIVGQSWHTYRWEAGGMAVLGSIQPQPVETQPDGTLRLTDIAAAIKPDDPHFARTRLVVLENTTGGQVLPPAYVAEAAQLAPANPIVRNELVQTLSQLAYKAKLVPLVPRVYKVT